MDDLFLLSEVQMRRIEPFFPLSHGIPRVDDRRVISGIVFVIRNGLRWRDAPRDYGPHKTIYNRFVRWSRLGVFNKIFAELARRAGKPDQLMIDATHLKAHRTAASLLKKGLWFRRGLFVMLSPVHGSLRHVQAEFPLIQVVQISRASSDFRVTGRPGAKVLRFTPF